MRVMRMLMLLAVVLVVLECVGVVVAETPAYSIIHFSDPQYLSEGNPSVLNGTFDYFESLRVSDNVKLLVISGDLVQQYNSTTQWNTYLIGKTHTTIPIFEIPGNHDIYDGGNAALLPNYTFYDTYIGAGHINWSDTVEDFVFAGIGYTPIADQSTLDSLKLDIDADTSKFPVIVTHEYLYGNLSYAPIASGIQKNLINRPSLVLCGHWHDYNSTRLTYQKGIPVIEDINNFQAVTTIGQAKIFYIYKSDNIISKITYKDLFAYPSGTVGPEITVYTAPTTNFTYKQEHYINGSATGPQEFYQIPIKVSNTVGTSSNDLMYINGHSLNFPYDIVWSDQYGSSLDFAIESNTTDVSDNETFARFWVEVPYIPVGALSQTKIVCNYGNINITTSSSNLTNTFIRADHFDTESLDTSKWTVFRGTHTQSDSILTSYASSSTSYVWSTKYLPQSIAVIIRTNLSTSDGNFIGMSNPGDLSNATRARSTGVTNSFLSTISSGGVSTQTSTVIGPHNQQTRWEFIRNGSSSHSVFTDNTLIATHTTNLSNSNILAAAIGAASGKIIETDYVLIRNYSYPEPSHSTYLPESMVEMLAQFTPAGPLTIWYPNGIAFTDASTGSPTSWDWDFGDGSHSNLQNPTKYYTTTGMYQVVLNASNSYSYSTNSTWVESSINGFNVSNVSGLAPLPVKFTNSTVGNVTTKLWDFGDGATSTDANPTHIYALGNYTANYTVTHNGYSNSTYANITVYERVIASFTKTADGVVPLTVQFTDTSNNATAWEWSFGDGNTSTLQNPSYTYRIAKDYTVTLNASNNYSFSKTSKTVGAWSTWRMPNFIAMFMASIIYIIPSIIAIIGLGMMIYAMRHMGEPGMFALLTTGVVSFLSGVVVVIILIYTIYLMGGTMESLLGWA